MPRRCPDLLIHTFQVKQSIAEKMSAKNKCSEQLKIFERGAEWQAMLDRAVLTVSHFLETKIEIPPEMQGDCKTSEEECNEYSENKVYTDDSRYAN